MIYSSILKLCVLAKETGWFLKSGSAWNLQKLSSPHWTVHFSVAKCKLYVSSWPFRAIHCLQPREVDLPPRWHATVVHLSAICYIVSCVCSGSKQHWYYTKKIFPYSTLSTCISSSQRKSPFFATYLRTWHPILLYLPFTTYWVKQEQKALTWLVACGYVSLTNIFMGYGEAKLDYEGKVAQNYYSSFRANYFLSFNFHS